VGGAVDFFAGHEKLPQREQLISLDSPVFAEFIGSRRPFAAFVG
jgi:hypothetical protein